MASTTSYLLLLPLLLLPFAAAVDDECSTASHGKCYDRQESLRLKLIAIAVILIASLAGISAPLFSRSLPALHPDRDLFVIVKAFASGVILATGYMHVLPDAFDNLTSPCLPEKPWQEFPFTTFVAMLAAIFTLMVDSFMTAYYTRVRTRPAASSAAITDHESPLSDMAPVVHGHGHGFQIDSNKGVDQSAVLQRNRIIAQVLEMGIVVHSVVIGLSMGASQNPCTIRPLVAALCFHQLFEGMGLGGCILQAEYGFRMKATMAFFFATTTPFGVALGIGLSKVYRDNSPTALIVVGLLNACSAGLLHYTALVDLLAADFMGSKLQSSIKLQVWSFAAVLMGAGGMSLMAKWA